MAIIRRTSPFSEVVSLRNAMDRLFDETFWRPTWVARGVDEYPMPLDVRTTAEAVIVKAALPGVKPEDVEITIDGTTLTIGGHMAEEQEKDDQGFLVREIRRGSFSRSVTLSGEVDADKATASFENGIVMLTIPKAEQAKPRRIPIATAEAPAAHSAEPAR
jgi:HSP20 family protein